MKCYLLLGRMCLFVLWGGLVACQEEPRLTPEPTIATSVAAASPTIMSIPVLPPLPTLGTTTVIDDPIESYVTLHLYDYDTIIPNPTNWQATQEQLFNTYGENLFLQLTNFDPQTQTVLPEVATTWTANTEATVYTFTLRTDIPWVNYLPSTGETFQETDSEGNPRFVVAEDFVFGIQYFCHPTNAVSESFTILAPTITGCAAALSNTHFPNPPTVGVHAPAEDTLVFELTKPTGYFPIFTSLPLFSALPHWTIKAYGETWFEAGTVVTNGRFVLYELVHNVRSDLFRNPLLPYDMQGTGNIERVQSIGFPDIESGYGAWRIDFMDISPIPDSELKTHKEDFPLESLFFTDPTLVYLSIRMTKLPFNDVRIRRAFSAAIDRETLVNEFFPELVGRHFTLLNEGETPLAVSVGVGFDLDYAREQLAAAGFPNCDGLPLTLVGIPDDASHQLMALFIIEQWQEHLGCREEQIRIFPCHIYGLGDSYPCFEPGPDDIQALNFLYQTWADGERGVYSWLLALDCEQATYSRRPCTEVDEWLAAARANTDPAQRTALYRQIEEALFGLEGEFPVIPLFIRTTPYAQHHWLTTTPFLSTGAPWYNWTIDAEAQAAARNK